MTNAGWKFDHSSPNTTDIQFVGPATFDPANNAKMSIHSSQAASKATFWVAIPVSYGTFQNAMLTGRVRSRNLSGYAGPYCKSSGLFFFERDGKEDQPAGPDEWRNFAIPIPLDETTDTLRIGGMIAGSGDVWFDSITLRLGGQIWHPGMQGTVDPGLSTSALRYLKNVAHPLPADISVTDPGFSFLKHPLKGKRIVALGEATHGTSEIIKIKHALSAYLIRHAGFRTVVLETSMAEAEQINRYVNGEPGDVKQLLLNNTYPVWQTTEMASFIDWLRMYNRTADKKVRFAGIDMQFPEEALHQLRSAGLPEIQSWCDTLSQLLSGVRKKGDFPPLKNESRLEDMLRLSSMINEYFRKSVQDSSAFARYAAILHQFLEFQSPDLLLLNRDSCMFDNLKWLADKDPEEKIIIWAHNIHVSRYKLKVNGMVVTRFMGSHLDEKFGPEYYNMAFAVGHGNYSAFTEQADGTACYHSGNKLAPPFAGTYEEVLSRLNMPTFFLDLAPLSELPEGRELLKKRYLRLIGIKSETAQFKPSPLYPLYDGVIYIENTNPTHLLNPCNPAQ